MLTGGAMQFLVSNALISYATDTLLLSAGFVGTMFLLSRVWDSLSDPLLGFWIDSKSRKGSELSKWVYISALFIGVTFLFLWLNPFPAKSASSSAFFGCMLILFFSFMTLLYVPHYTLAVRLSADQQEVSSLYGVRALIENLGTFLALMVLALVVGSTGSLILVMGLLALVHVVMSIVHRKSMIGKEINQVSTKNENLSSLFKHKALLLTLLVASLGQVGATLLMATAPYQAKYIFGQEEAGSILVGIFFLAATIGIPLWNLIAKRIGILKSWMLGELGLSLAFMLFFFVADQLNAPLYLLCIVAGFSAAAPLFLQPAVISATMQNTQSDQQALAFSLFTFFNKLAMGLGVFLLGFFLEVVGYRADSEITPQILQTIQLIFSMLPAAFFLVAFLLIWSQKKKFAFLQ